MPLEDPMGEKNVVVPGVDYLRLLREEGKARQLAAYILGVLSVGTFDKKAAQTIREKCGEFYPGV